MKRYKTSKYEILQIFIQGRSFHSHQLSRVELTVNWDEKTQFTKTLENPDEKNPKNPKFNEAISLKYIFEVQQKAKIICYSSKGKIGEVNFKISELVASKFNMLQLPLTPETLSNSKLKIIFEGIVSEGQRNMLQQKKFLSYLRGNMKLSVTTCIDLTASNLSAKPKPLHFISNGYELNEYQKAISSVCSILLDYDDDKLIPVYGFGAIPIMEGFEEETSHYFPLSGDWNKPSAHGIQEMFDVYSKSLNCVQMSGPTLFSPLLEEVNFYFKKYFSFFFKEFF